MGIRSVPRRLLGYTRRPPDAVIRLGDCRDSHLDGVHRNNFRTFAEVSSGSNRRLFQIIHFNWSLL